MPQSNDLGVNQKTGNRWLIAITALIVIGFHILFASLPNMKPIFHNVGFIILDVIAIAVYVKAASIVFKMIFETYFTWEILFLIGITVAIILLFFAFGGAAETKAINGGI